MQNRWRLPYEQIIYVGDNPNKDFQACRQLGMRWKYFRNEDGLYFDGETGRDEQYFGIYDLGEKNNESIGDSTTSG